MALENSYCSSELLLFNGIQDFSPDVGFRVYRQGDGEWGTRLAQHAHFIGVGALAAVYGAASRTNRSATPLM